MLRFLSLKLFTSILQNFVFQNFLMRNLSLRNFERQSSVRLNHELLSWILTQVISESTRRNYENCLSPICNEWYQWLNATFWRTLLYYTCAQLPRSGWPDRSDPWSDEFRAHSCSRCARITWSAKGFERTFVWTKVWNLPDQRPLWSGTVWSEKVSSAH